MKTYYPEKNSLTLIKLLLFVPFIFALALSKYFLSSIPIIMWACMALFSIAYVCGVLVWLPLYFRKTFYCVSRKEITKNSGVWYKKHQLMKVSSIQYLTRMISPLSKFTGLNFIRFNALGGGITLMFLSREDAEEIATLIASEIRLKETDF